MTCLGKSDTGMTLTEISAAIKIGKSTVHRLLATLLDEDFVWLDPYSSRYILGAKVLQLSNQLTHQSILIRYVGPVLKRLATVVNETCNLGVLEGDQVHYLIIEESAEPLRMSEQVGTRLPASCTALGKALLSDLSVEEVTQIYSAKGKLPIRAPNSVKNLPELLSQLQKVRRMGMELDNEELYRGVTCLAAPVRDHSGKVIAAISISLPKNRAFPRRLDSFKDALLAAVQDLSRQLGHQFSSVKEAPREAAS